MDRLELFIAEYDNPSFWMSGKPGEVVDFFVNGRNLLDILEDCFRQGNRKFNQVKYIGIRPEDAFLPSTHLLGQSEWTTCGQTLLYTCSECAVPSCASIHTQITVMNHLVTWRRFTNVASVADGDFEESFVCKTPVFMFDRANYEAALRYHLARKVNGLVTPRKRW